MSATSIFEQLEREYQNACAYHDNVVPQAVLGEACARQIAMAHGTQSDSLREWLEKWTKGASMFAEKYGIQFDPELVMTLLREFTETWENWDNSKGTC